MRLAKKKGRWPAPSPAKARARPTRRRCRRRGAVAEPMEEGERAALGGEGGGGGGGGAIQGGRGRGGGLCVWGQQPPCCACAPSPRWHRPPARAFDGAFNINGSSVSSASLGMLPRGQWFPGAPQRGATRVDCVIPTFKFISCPWGAAGKRPQAPRLFRLPYPARHRNDGRGAWEGAHAPSEEDRHPRVAVSPPACPRRVAAAPGPPGVAPRPTATVGDGRTPRGGRIFFFFSPRGRPHLPPFLATSRATPPIPLPQRTVCTG